MMYVRCVFIDVKNIKVRYYVGGGGFILFLMLRC